MDGFFKGFNLARALIVLCIVGACIMGWKVFDNQKRIDVLTTKLGLGKDWVFEEASGGWLKGQVEKSLSLAANYTKLHKQVQGEGLLTDGKEDVATYIRAVARMENIELGQLTISPKERSERAYVDKDYLIAPDKTDAARSKKDVNFDRTKIANFMFKLEEGSSRVRVTRFMMRSPQSISDKDYQRPGPEYDFNCTMTVREKRETSDN